MQRIALTLAGVFALALAGCPSDNGGGNAGGTGGGGTGGRGGSSGTGGTPSTGGTGGTAGTGGISGTGGAKAPDAGVKRDTGKAPDSGKAPDGGRRDGAGGVDMGGAASVSPMMSVFITSDTSMTGNLGGLDGADMRCQRLAAGVGLGNKTWKAYLSAEMGPVNARDRIGSGPWFNSKGAMVAASVAALHTRNGDSDLFLNEQGVKINGQWGRVTAGAPNEHDILTGSNADGTVAAGKTCNNWTGTAGASRVGHSDGLGPNMNAAPPFNSWNSSHDGQCGNTAPGGGSGRIYCFATN